MRKVISFYETDAMFPRDGAVHFYGIFYHPMDDFLRQLFLLFIE
jgi:hypothetical protein